ncbi:MAG: hypothetical protein L3J76_00580 [Candidatus Hydrothermae bacterium]|nr:hypothetical protein [Candidatus Hydrothermae bacterium]
MTLAVLLLSLSPQLQNVLSRIQAYPFAPQPSTAHDTVRGSLIFQIGTLHAETLHVVRTPNTLQIFRHDSLLLSRHGDSVNLLGSMFHMPVPSVDSTFWKRARLRKEGSLDVVEGTLPGGGRLSIWVDEAGRIQRQRVEFAGGVVQTSWVYDPATGFVRELVIRKGNGTTFRVAYRWEAK